jgi:hypothetical protein
MMGLCIVRRAVPCIEIGRGSYTNEHEMITPCVLSACCDALLKCYLDGVGMIDN